MEQNTAKGLCRKVRPPFFLQGKVQHYGSVTLFISSVAGCEGRVFLVAFCFF